jgi:hypothetical protein
VVAADLTVAAPVFWMLAESSCSAARRDHSRVQQRIHAVLDAISGFGSLSAPPCVR